MIRTLWRTQSHRISAKGRRHPDGNLLSMVFRSRAAVAASLLLTAWAAVWAPAARAAELVTLRNGFTVNCSSREIVSADTVRLHLVASEAEPQNYMDVPAGSIAAIEAVPDAPAVKETAAALPVAGVAGIAQRSGETHNVNATLLMAVIRAESAGNAHAVSRTGARGLMQLMPGTAARLGVSDSFSPEENVNGGSAYLDRLLTRYHENIALALAAYNAGPGAVDRYHGIPPYRETQLYVAKVIREWNSLVAAARIAASAPERAESR